MKLFIKLLITSILCIPFIVKGQNNVLKIRGRVLDRQTDEVIAGVNVFNKLKNPKTQTSLNGDFVINLGVKDDSLYFQKIGYQSLSIPLIGSTTEYTVYLTAAVNHIDEVVVNTGYQQLKPNEITGSYQVLTSKDLMRQSSPNILQRMNNEAVGLRLDNVPENIFGQESPNFTVRGLNTINGNTAPLIVLDGFIYEGNISNIDPNNVASISLLKDASATSIWGARAGNGVIVITTKGKQLMDQPATISFNKVISLKSKPNLTDVYSIDPSSYIDIEKFIFEKGYYDRSIANNPHIAITPAIEILLQHRLNNITVQERDNELLTLSNVNGQQNFEKYFLNNPFTDQYALNMSAATKKHSYSIAAGYLNDKNYNAAKFKKINLHFSNSYSPIDALRIDFNMMYSNSIQQSGKAKYSDLTYNKKQVPYLSFYDELGMPKSIDLSFRSDYLQTKYGANYLDWKYYPTEEFQYNGSLSKIEELFGNASIRYKVSPFLEALVAGQYQIQRSVIDQHQTIDSYSMRMLINQFSEYDALTNKMQYPVPIGGRLNKSFNDGVSYTFRGQLNGNREWGKHGIIVLLGSEVRQNLVEGSTSSLYGYSADPLRNVPVNYAVFYNQIPAGGTGTIPGVPLLSHGLNRFVSLYGNLVYTLDKKYNVSMSMRRDGANIFGAQTNDRWRPLWSIGANWNIHQESFWKTSWVNTFKLRTTYGYSGNVDVRRTPLPVGTSTIGLHTNFPAIIIDNLNDPSLRWEKVSTWNIGLDFSLFANRLSGALDYYRKTGDDLYGQTTYDYTVWGQSATITNNSAMMKSSGVDIVINSKNIVSSFGWDTRILFAINKDKTVKYYNNIATDLNYILSGGQSINPILGLPLHALAAFKWGGLNDKGNPQGYLNGELSTNYSAIRSEGKDVNNPSSNVIIFGSSKPQLFGSLLNSFTYKGFALDVNLSFKADYYVRKPSTSYATLFATGEAYKDIESRWQKIGDENVTNMPSMVYPVVTNRETFYKSASIHVIKGDHVRVEYINLSWSTNLRNSKRRIPAQIYVQMQNLGVLWRDNKDQIDPEYINRYHPLKTSTVGFRISY